MCRDRAVMQEVHTMGKGQQGCLPQPRQGSACPLMAALLSESGRNLPVSRVSERPLGSEMRGEPAWGGRLARTAENSGPDPKPIKLMERLQRAAGTHGTVPLLTQHISGSPRESCTY